MMNAVKHTIVKVLCFKKTVLTVVLPTVDAFAAQSQCPAIRPVETAGVHRSAQGMHLCTLNDLPSLATNKAQEKQLSSSSTMRGAFYRRQQTKLS